MNVVINKIPKEMWINDSNIDFAVFAEKFMDYMENFEDREKVKTEIKKNEESFDYNLIRWNYV